LLTVQVLMKWVLLALLDEESIGPKSKPSQDTFGAFIYTYFFAIIRGIWRHYSPFILRLRYRGDHD